MSKKREVMFEAKQRPSVSVHPSSVQGYYLLFHIAHGFGLFVKEHCTTSFVGTQMI